MLKIAIIVGSTRPGRKGDAIARWAYEIARRRTDADFELVDIASFNLPVLDEPVPAMSAEQYSHGHTRTWSAAIAARNHRDRSDPRAAQGPGVGR